MTTSDWADNQPYVMAGMMRQAREHLPGLAEEDYLGMLIVAVAGEVVMISRKRDGEILWTEPRTRTPP
jgi:DNA-directed RNA polymerase subunit H (RpoH/RPB5)